MIRNIATANVANLEESSNVIVLKIEGTQKIVAGPNMWCLACASSYLG